MESFGSDAFTQAERKAGGRWAALLDDLMQPVAALVGGGTPLFVSSFVSALSLRGPKLHRQPLGRQGTGPPEPSYITVVVDDEAGAVRIMKLMAGPGGTGYTE